MTIKVRGAVLKIPSIPRYQHRRVQGEILFGTAERQLSQPHSVFYMGAITFAAEDVLVHGSFGKEGGGGGPVYQKNGRMGRSATQTCKTRVRVVLSRRRSRQLGETKGSLSLSAQLKATGRPGSEVTKTEREGCSCFCGATFDFERRHSYSFVYVAPIARLEIRQCRTDRSFLGTSPHGWKWPRYCPRRERHWSKLPGRAPSHPG